jgi:hypothetical protein
MGKCAPHTRRVSVCKGINQQICLVSAFRFSTIPPPDPVTDLQVIVVGQTATISWAASELAEHYRVEIVGEEDRTEITENLTIDFLDLEPGEYMVAVFAVNDVGSSPGVTDSFEISGVPPAPENFGVEVMDVPLVAEYKFFRLHILSDNGGSSFIGTTEFGLKDQIEGTSIAIGAGGTPFAMSQHNDFPVSGAFNGVKTLGGGNGWVSESSNPAFPHNIGYEFNDPKQIVQYGVGTYPTTTDTVNRSIREFILQGSNNGIDWDDLDEREETNWDPEEYRLFEIEYPDHTIARCTWDPVVDVDGYNVYLKLNGEFEKHNSVLIEGTQYDIPDLETGEYEAHVTSVRDGLESEPSNVESFAINIFFTDFSEYETGVQPNDWDVVGGGGTWSVQEKGDAIGERALRFTGANSGDNYLRWASIPIGQDFLVEARVLAETKGTNTRVRVLNRVGNNITSYSGELTGFTGYELAIQKHINGVFTNLINDANANTFNSQTWYLLSIEVVGNQLRAKFHEESAPDPGWQLTATDSDISEGRPGVSMRVNSTSNFHWMDWIKVTKLD